MSAPPQAISSTPAMRPRAVTGRDGLLQEHVQGEADDPIQVHDAAVEQQRHQEPAAAGAERPVLDPHAQGAEIARRQCWVMKANGERQWRRQACLSGVS